MSTPINPKAVGAAEAVLNSVDPYVPQAVKDASSYAVNTASNLLPDIAKNFGIYAINTATTVVESGISTATSTQKALSDGVTATRDYAAGKVSQTLDLGKVAVQGATTTISAYTPSPVVSAVTSAIEGAKSLGATAADGAKAIRTDPAGALKPYVPAFVIHVGEKSYEIVSHTVEQTQTTVSNTTKSISDTTKSISDGVRSGAGVIVTKVNGTVHSITEIPAIHTLIEKIEAIVQPILARLGAAPKAAAAVEEKAQ